MDPYASSMLIIDATMKCEVPAMSLPPQDLMERVRERWQAYGLPDLRPRPRLDRLLRHHAERG